MAYISDDEKQLYSRVEDTIRLCSKRNTPCFLGFLDQREQALIVRRASVFGDVKWHLFGGYEGAERAVLAVFPDFFQEEYLEFPFGAVAFHYRKAQKLTHRDFLGTLMAAGVRRDTIGDILCGEGLTVVFLRASAYKPQGNKRNCRKAKNQRGFCKVNKNASIFLDHKGLCRKDL